MISAVDFNPQGYTDDLEICLWQTSMRQKVIKKLASGLKSAPRMNTEKLTEKLLQLFKPLWKQSKALGAIGKDLGDAADNELILLYDKVRDWFTKEDEAAEKVWETYSDTLNAGKEDPKTEGKLATRLELKLEEDAAFAETLQNELDEKEARLFETINRIEEIIGNRNRIIQGSGNTGTGGSTLNEIRKVEGDGNYIEQGSNNQRDGKKKA